MPAIIIYILCIMNIFCFSAQALTFQIHDPCQTNESLIEIKYDINGSDNLLNITKEFLKENEFKFLETADGNIVSIQDTPVGKTELVDDSSNAHQARFFGWAYTFNHMPLERPASEVIVHNYDTIVWYYVYQDSFKLDGKIIYFGRTLGSRLNIVLEDWSAEWYVITVCVFRNFLRNFFYEHKS